MTNGIWTVSGSGSDIWGASDQFQYAYESFTGDGSIVAYVASEGNTDPWAKAGLMFRSSTAANDLFAALVVTPGNGVILQWRKAIGSSFGLNQATGISAPVWLKLVRTGNNFIGFYSGNGTNWTQVGSTQTVAVAALATVGLCVDSHSNTNLNTSTLTNVGVTAPPLPSVWSDYDVGSPATAGSASYLAANGTWVVSGGGAGIGGTTDQFNSLSQPLDGDGSVIAQIATQGNTGPGVQAGVMIRGDSTAISAFAYVGVTPSNSVSFLYRSTAGTNISSIAADGTIATPIWVRLTQVANNFSASFSYDSVNWDELGAAQTVSLGAIAQAGLAVSASNNAAISTATFSNVCVVPSDWADMDIGSPGVAGSANFDGSNLTAGGSGANIWGMSDQFNFASQSYVGDVAIVAKITSLTNGAANAKAGVMIRERLGANASYAFMLLTPNSGGGSPAANFEYRNGTGSNSQSAASATGISAPYWVKLMRQGNKFTAYYSADGMNWVQNGSSVNIPMSATIQIGVAVDANNSVALSTAAFSNVSVTPATWSDTDVGSPVITGSAHFDGLTWSVSGSGYDVGDGTDQLNFASQSFAGDVTVVAQVGSLVNVGTNAGAGVMIRDGATINASGSYAHVFFTPNDTTNGQDVIFEYRNGAGTVAQIASSTAGVSTPNWVKLVRSSNSFSAYYSTDGVNWVAEGSITLSMGLTTQAGLAVSSNNTNNLASATFANVSVGTFQTDLFLKQNGRDMRNGHGNGDVVPLHGVNVGTWLMYEPSFGAMDNSGLPDAYTVYSTLTTRFGVAGRNRIEDAYQFNWITTADLDAMRSWGMTCIRVPFWYLNVVETNGTWRSDAFTHLDWMVNEAYKRGIYTVLDFHGLPGGDCPWASCGEVQSSGQFFSVYSNQVEGASIWYNIAAHFKGNPGIAAYDVMNEPNSAPDSGTLWNIYNWYFWTIRGADLDHTIQLEGNWDWSTLPNPSWYGWYNVAYHQHAYAFGVNGTYNPTTVQVDGAAWGALASYQNYFSYNIPDYIGEFAGNTDPSSFEYEHAVFNAYGVGWANWTWKAEGGSNDEWADTIPYNWPWVPNLQTDTMPTILSDYATVVTPGHYQANALLRNTMAEPYATADTYTLTEDQSLYVTASSGVLSNDVDVNGYQLSAELANNVSHGELTLWSDGSFYYIPTPGFVGTDTFRYRASDANGWSPNTITVTLIVQPGSPTALPSGWTNTDIGSPGLAGNSSFNWSNAVWTVAGSGGDIWSGTDQFQYAYQSLTGNGAIIARVDSVQNTDPWAKAGVMIRETLDPSSRDAMMAITSSNGAIFEWRSIANGTTSGSTSSGISAPYWVMVQRAGSVFSGYISSNGVSWTQVGSATMVMAGTVNVGLAVTAHNNSSLNPATFDNVAVTLAPGAPTGLTATAGDGQVALTWTLSSGATSYNVLRAPFGGSFSIITNVASTAYVDHNVTNGTTYYYIVTAVNMGGVSGNSNEVGATPIGYQQWVNQYFPGNPSMGATNLDADGTGQNNLFKYVAGLDATNPSSVFQLNVQAVATNEPTWMGLTYNPIAAGRTYTIEFRTDSPSGSYTTLTGASSPQTNGNQVTVIDLNATQSNKFYRVHISMP